MNNQDLQLSILSFALCVNSCFYDSLGMCLFCGFCFGFCISKYLFDEKED